MANLRCNVSGAIWGLSPPAQSFNPIVSQVHSGRTLTLEFRYFCEVQPAPLSADLAPLDLSALAVPAQSDTLIGATTGPSTAT